MIGLAHNDIPQGLTFKLVKVGERLWLALV
jgi:hypothetical protein